MSIIDKIKGLISKPQEKETTPTTTGNYALDKLNRDRQKKVPVILDENTVEDEPYLAVMGDDFCIAVNHKYYHKRLNCPCLEWELENDNEYTHRKQFTMKEAKAMKMLYCRNCESFIYHMEHDDDDENEDDE